MEEVGQVNRPGAKVGLRLFGLQVSNRKMDILVLHGFTDSKVSVFLSIPEKFMGMAIVSPCLPAKWRFLQRFWYIHQCISIIFYRNLAEFRRFE